MDPNLAVALYILVGAFVVYILVGAFVGGILINYDKLDDSKFIIVMLIWPIMIMALLGALCTLPFKEKSSNA